MKRKSFLIMFFILITVIFILILGYSFLGISDSMCKKIGGTVTFLFPINQDLCPTCLDCYDCINEKEIIFRHEHGTVSKINSTEECPICESCFKCEGENFGKCPRGKKKIAQISNIAAFAYCCI